MANTSEEHIVRILSAESVTHNVRRFKLERPAGYDFEPGQATDLCINKPAWQEERRPFTFTGLQEWDHLEFTIKIYNDHPGVTAELGKLKAGEELILHDVFGAIIYKGEGVFLAGGAGITPFIAIFRDLHRRGQLANNRLFFSNRAIRDIILQEELESMLGDHFKNTLTQELAEGYDHGQIDKAYLQKNVSDFSQYFYICGPDPMVLALQKTLAELGVEEDRIVVEQF